MPRQKELERHNDEGEQMQRHVLATLLESAKDTEYGRKHLFDIAKGYEDFTANTPLNTYEELKGGMERETCSGREQ